MDSVLQIILNAVLFITMIAIGILVRGLTKKVEAISAEQGKIDVQLSRLDDVATIHSRLKEVERMQSEALEVLKTKLTLGESVFNKKLESHEAIQNKLGSLFYTTIITSEIKEKCGSLSLTDGAKREYGELSPSVAMHHLWKLIYSEIRFLDADYFEAVQECIVKTAEAVSQMDTGIVNTIAKSEMKESYYKTVREFRRLYKISEISIEALEKLKS